jgi:selenoprotein W-related protein
VSVVNDLLSNYQHIITDLKLITGSKGIFDVTVNGKMVYSKTQTGRHDEPGEVLGLFKELVGPEVNVFGS